MDSDKKSIYYTVANIAAHEGSTGHYEVKNDAVAALCELVLYFSESLAKDLEAFAAHAKRATVSPSDVRLAARRQPKVVSQIDELISSIDEEKKKKKKKNDPSSYRVLLSNISSQNLYNCLHFNRNSQSLALRNRIFQEMDMCLPFSPKISTKTSEAPFTTAGTFSNVGHAFTNPVIYGEKKTRVPTLQTRTLVGSEISAIIDPNHNDYTKCSLPTPFPPFLKHRIQFSRRYQLQPSQFIPNFFTYLSFVK
ncbi:uncharacterized protein [Blastocystis hominis]|uniref:Centromere protein S n=1 Tax=Blastocystis hominis TaxID=12968 RepID=D8LZ85_BLAHO|nr:uncharacterized protein [Blastocystis hominis]CBK21124.2 unnamed protein product [Blastocystis hominis]|eukprot:XP_012895172.1 uncharacterized protein [Blastocystis hominis]